MSDFIQNSLCKWYYLVNKYVNTETWDFSLIEYILRNILNLIVKILILWMIINSMFYSLITFTDIRCVFVLVTSLPFRQ